MNTKQTEARRQVAERVIEQWYERFNLPPQRLGLLADAIETALKAEAEAQRERAARIIREHRESDKCEGSCWAIITETIRNGDKYGD